MKFTFFVFAALLSSAFAGIESFQADVVVTNDPTVPNAVMTGHVAVIYDGDATTESVSKSVARITSSGHTVVELLIQAKGERYRACGDLTGCDAESTTDLVQPLMASAFTAKQTTATINGETCIEYTRTTSKDNEVAVLYVKASDRATPCSAHFHSGKVWTFSNQQFTAEDALFTEPSDCEKPTCKRVMDVIFNLDASSSIGSSEWKTYKKFVNETIHAFDLGTDKTNVAIIRFNAAGTVVSGLTADGAAAFKTLNDWRKTGSGTCAGAGINLAFEDVIPARSRTRAALNPATVIITISDGADSGNCKKKGTTDISMNTYGDTGATFIALGVGDGINETGLDIMANRNSNNVIISPTFDDLKNRITQLVATTCDALPPVNLCGDTCKGFCNCKTECVTPVCVPENCKVIEALSNTSGCVVSNKNCGVDNACMTYGCDATTGDCFEESTITSEMQKYQDDTCYTVSCDAKTGWSVSSVVCEAPTDPCKEVIRDSTADGCCVTRGKTCPTQTCMVSGCSAEENGCYLKPMTETPYSNCDVVTCESDVVKHTPKECDQPDKCKVFTCDLTDGKCKGKDIEYPNPDPCYNYVCDPSKSEDEKWIITKKSGCNYCTLNTGACSDVEPNNDCDVVTCVSSDSYNHECKHVQMSETECARTVCPGGCDDGDPCTTDTCDTTSAFGCVHEKISGCDACSLHPCIQGNGDGYDYGLCDELVECYAYEGYQSSRRECITESAAENRCKEDDLCYTYGCDEATGKCTKTAIKKSESNSIANEDPCYTYSCNPATGIWDVPTLKYEGCNWCTLETDGVKNAATCSAEAKNNDCDVITCVSSDSYEHECKHTQMSEAECADLVCSAGCDDGDPCTVDTCIASLAGLKENEELGCRHEKKSDCDACSENPCPDQTCMDVVCTVKTPEDGAKADNTANGRTCTYYHKAKKTNEHTGSCFKGDFCVEYGCDFDSGDCTEKPAAKPVNLNDECMKYTCNSVEEKWDSTIIYDGCTWCTVHYGDSSVGCVNAEGECGSFECDAGSKTCTQVTLDDTECAKRECPTGCPPTDPSNKCKRSYCDFDSAADDKCVEEDIPGCTACDYKTCEAKNCMDVIECGVDEDNPQTTLDCKYASSVRVGGSRHGGNLCLVYECDEVTGDVTTKKKQPPYEDNCYDWSCDSSTGVFTENIKYEGCNYCTLNADACSEEEKTNACDVITCVSSDSRNHECKHTQMSEAECAPIVCPVSACTAEDPDACAKNPCDDGDPCTIDTCITDPADLKDDEELGCHHEPIDDCHACTVRPCVQGVDYGLCEELVECIPREGYKNKERDCSVKSVTAKGGRCDGDNKCYTYSCVEATGMCHPTPIAKSESNSIANEDPCYTYSCNPKTGIWDVATLIPGCNWCTLETNGVKNAATCTADEKKCKLPACSSPDSYTIGCYEVDMSEEQCIAEVCLGIDSSEGSSEDSENPCDDGDPCTEDICDTTSVFGCVHKPIEGCDACTLQPCVRGVDYFNCDDFLGCVPVAGTKNNERECRTRKSTGDDGSCKGDNMCRNYFCTEEDGCYSVEIAYSGKPYNKCQYATCHPTNGSWTVHDVTCEASDACHTSECDLADGLCKEKLKYNHTTCMVESCDSVTGEVTSSELNCETGNPCLIGYCHNDACLVKAKECEYKNCKVASCNANAKEGEDACTYTDRTCPGSVCYPATCDAQTDECGNTTKCVPDLYFCKENICVGEGECLTPSKRYSGDKPLTAEEEGCFEYVCYEDAKEWKKEVIASAFLDSCGRCYQGFNQFYDGDVEDVACVAGIEATEFGVGIGAVAAAGIVMAAIVGVAIVATSGFFGTKELMRLASASSSSGMSNNPLYEEDGVQIDNPMFDGAV